ncbi:transketolase [[Mycobacterium] kokjensenii]|uniref:Transketolase n=1 Tax=[Mycobacterium] kokjensenii TaxID=3064287 RepID=A0ABN9MRF0_9MYCO|nr:transketolase [Mycolicibacter sp. MU0083]CAJ1493095.1 transketolase [Mycolicibacter sp. MU0083]
MAEYRSLQASPRREAAELREIARRLRLHAMSAARGKGEAYIGQALQSAELFAVLYFRELNWSPDALDDDARDRCLLSVGHYGLSHYAAMAEHGLLSPEQLQTYGADGSALTLGAEPGEVPGVEFAGGSLGQGLGVAGGMAWGLRYRGNPARVFNYMSDGEIQEGATWEAAMFAGARGLSNLTTVVDVNRTQADGDLVLEIEPLTDKFRAFGWWATDVDGNDVDALIDAFTAADGEAGPRPRAIIAHTRLAQGAPSIQNRRNAHFVRMSPDEWETAQREIEEGA